MSGTSLFSFLRRGTHRPPSYPASAPSKIVSTDEHAEIDSFDESTSGTSRIATGESKSGKEEANVISGYKATISSECFLDVVKGEKQVSRA